MTQKQLGFFFDADRCIMCRACELACKAVHDLQPGVNWRKVIEISHGEFPVVSRTFVSLSCLHCAEPPCVHACSTGAISKRADDGIVIVDTDICTGCRECLFVCPYRIPQFGTDGTMQKCDLCFGLGIAPACAAPCPADALFFGTMEDLARLATEKSAQRLDGPGGPSLFLRSPRGSEIDPRSLLPAL